jgi:hypothetical protein
LAVSRSLRFQILRRDSHTCRYCGRAAPEVKLTVDHVLPETLGGTNDPSNLVAACAECNGGKSATPPDAALVAQVDEDAIRWAQARHAAAERMLANREARTQDQQEFEQAWDRWKADGHPLRLSPEWKDTVDRFLSLGLPMPILIECIDIAMTRKVRTNRFNYMCGVAWNRLAEIDEMARAIVGAPDPDSAAGDEAIERVAAFTGVATRLLESLPPWIALLALRKSEYDFHCAGEDPEYEEAVRNVLRHTGQILAACEIYPRDGEPLEAAVARGIEGTDFPFPAYVFDDLVRNIAESVQAQRRDPVTS